MIISVEGIDGAGKTTLIKALEKALRERGIEVEVFREPGTTKAGEKIRDILKSTEIDPLTELLLFEASRRELVATKLKGTRKKVILIDRFSDSSTAYQGYGKGVDLKLIELLNERVTEGIKPDLTILLDIDPDTALSRIGKRDRFEDREFLQKVRKGFLKIASADRDRFLILSGEEPKEEVLNKALTRVMELLGEDF